MPMPEYVELSKTNSAFDKAKPSIWYEPAKSNQQAQGRYNSNWVSNNNNNPDNGDNNDNNNDPDDYPWGGGYGGYGGGGSGGGSSNPNSHPGPTEIQIELGTLQRPLSGWTQDTLLGKADNARDVYNIGDQGSRNIANFETALASKKLATEWFSNLLKELSVYKQQREKMGNARYGSAALDLNTDVSRQHDATAVGILEAMESAWGDINTELAQSLQSSVNGWNEFAMDIEEKLRNNAGEYVQNLINIHPQLATGDYAKGITGYGDEREEGDAPEDADKFPALVDDDREKLVIPDRLKTTFYNDNKREAVVPDWIGLTRPDAATQNAWANKQNPGTRNAASSANGDYWKRMYTDYGHREV